MNVSYRLPDPNFEPSRDIKDKRGHIRKGVVQLQSADLFAYELRKQRREFADRTGRPVRKSFYGALKVPLIAMASFNERNVVQLCQLENPLQRRVTGTVL